MKIAILGLRSIGPTALGGIEKVVEELSTRYVAEGHEVTVFVRARYAADSGDEYRGVRLKALPAVYTKHLEAITNTVIAILYSLRGYDIVHVNALGPALLSFIPRLFGRKVFVTVHGQDWKREKWGRFASRVLRLGEWAAVTFPTRTVVVSRTLREYEKKRFGRDVLFIPNGVNPPDTNVEPRGDGRFPKDGYVLFMGRLVPEKGCHFLIRAFRSLQTDKKLVIAGAALHTDEYAAGLHRLAEGDDRIEFVGPIYEEEKDLALRNALLFALPSTIEGMAIVLLEAMSYGKCCLCSDIDENLEVIYPASEPGTAVAVNERFLAAGDGPPDDRMRGLCFRSGDIGDLAAKLDFLIGHRAAVDALGMAAKQHVAEYHDWDRIARLHLDAYGEALHGDS
ncbi:MAG: glycosyltransferase family 4 protein [Proteobacteria bacterium]|nr:glycosyltransferase family 4 protein [Pseudomonadota bacterium]